MAVATGGTATSNYSITAASCKVLNNTATVKAGELVKAGAIGKVLQTIGLGPHRAAARPERARLARPLVVLGEALLLHREIPAVYKSALGEEMYLTRHQELPAMMDALRAYFALPKFSCGDRLDGYVNYAFRSLKNDRDGRHLERRLDAAESVPWLLDTVFALEGRVRPYIHPPSPSRPTRRARPPRFRAFALPRPCPGDRPR